MLVGDSVNKLSRVCIVAQLLLQTGTQKNSFKYDSMYPRPFIFTNLRLHAYFVNYAWQK
jgi:hypothetical protein